MAASNLAELHGLAQLSDRGTFGELRVVLIRTLTGMLGHHANLIQRQPALAHRLSTARELLDPVRDGHHDFRMPR